jgi:hypothetical protein
MRFLKRFEKKYAEYLEAKERREEEGPEIGWSAAQLEAREEELKGLAPQAEAAINVSGAGRVVVYRENSNTGHRYPVTDNLRAAMFGPEENFGLGGKSPYTKAVRQEVLEKLPTQIEALEAQLKARRSAGQRLREVGQRFRESAEWVMSWWGRREHPLLVLIVGGAAGILLAAAVVAVLSG